MRDLLCGRPPVDYDLAVATAPDKFAKVLAANTGGKAVKFGKHGHTIHRVVIGDCHFDIMPLNGETIEQDLIRRDFTINALALEVSSGRLIDMTGGRRDMAAKTIRMVKRDVFRRDPVRLVRAYRMAAAFGFSIDKGTEAAIARDSGLIQNTAGERIREELFKILNLEDSHAQLVSMARTGLLFGIFPELIRLNSSMSDDQQPGNLFEQTLTAYRHLEDLLYSPQPEQPESMDRLLKALSVDEGAVLLKWSALFQHIGLPPAKPATAGGSGFLNGHAVRSAAMSREICRRLKFSRRHSDTIEFIIRHHLEPFALFNARQENAPAERAFIRFYMACGDRTPAILLHALAGTMSRNTADALCIQRFADFVTEGIDCIYSILQPRAATPPPLSGNDLIKHFGLKPSTMFKEILAALEEEHLAGEEFTREEALEFVEKRLNMGTD